MIAKRNNSENLPSFRNPPINEVVCGIKFEVLRNFKLPHFGLFWDSVRKTFPLTEHAPTLGGGILNVDEATGLPIPRVWLINRMEDRLIQIQNDMFYCNWRDRGKKKSYPRYNTLIQQFRKNFSLFDKFIDEYQLGPLKPTDCELTYINYLPEGSGWSTAAHFGKIFPDFMWRSNIQRFLPLPDQITWRSVFSLPENKGDLEVKLQPGVRKIDETPVLVLELRARGLGPDKSLNAVWDWFSTAHEWIVRGFADITGPEIQEEIWKRDDSFTK